MSNLTYISLFSSAGVGCYGLKKLGYKCIATNEIIEKRLNIQKYNKICEYDSGYIAGDITQKEYQHKIYQELELWRRKHNIKKPNLVIATPPCQGMSVANHKKKNELNRNSLVVESIKITKDLQPDFFIYENVQSFLKTTCTDSDGKLKTIKEAIDCNLAGNYNILYKVINFKDYGSKSSRTRALVLGVNKNILGVSPYDFFPDKQKSSNLKHVIGKLTPLKKMGEIDRDDFYHSFRKYKPEMRDWIKNLKEGESAFDNKNPKKRPHQIINGKIVQNKRKNGDKYTRCEWDKICPCIHTRNDILASQNTIHPHDDRVFSIRELMRVMTIPNDFNWLPLSLKDLNNLSEEEKSYLLKKEELNIRKCIGEAVPTIIFSQIAKKIKSSSYSIANKSNYKKTIEEKELTTFSNLYKFIDDNFALLTLEEIFKFAELSNPNQKDTAAYYTRQDIIYTLIKDLPAFDTKKEINIIEPATGAGNFIPQLFKKYENTEKVNLDLFDIDQNAIEILKLILNKIGIPKNFNVKFINQDFLLYAHEKKYDLAIGNPPFLKITKNPDLLNKYKENVFNNATNNIFSFFIEKSLHLANYISLIVPKSLINTPEFNLSRELLSKYSIQKLCDYGEKGFKGVKIETISLTIQTTRAKLNEDITLESYITQEYSIKKHNYIMDKAYPYWIIYRNDFFDMIAKKLEFDIFKVFRDRQLTKKNTCKNGKIRVLKSRNIGNLEVIDINEYDTFVNDIKQLSVAKFYNKTDTVLIPNLTYYPRATFLPKNSITDGSVALLSPTSTKKPRQKDLKYYSTKDFYNFYKVARNYGTRSLNIDSNSVFFFGRLK